MAGENDSKNSSEFDYNNTPDTGKAPAASESSDKAPSISDQVNTLVSSMVETDGKWEIPTDKLEGADPAIVYAAKAEKRVRDTQSSYTKSRQRVKELETVTAGLTDHMVKNATMHLTNEEQEELDDLRTSDPDKWRDKLNEHEETAKAIQNEKIKEFNAEGKQASEGEMRTSAYDSFKERTGIELNDQVIDTKLPASYMKNVKEGKWSFEQFLTETEKFLVPPTTVAGAGKTDKELNAENDKDMNKMTGGQQPSNTAQEVDSAQAYANEIF